MSVRIAIDEIFKNIGMDFDIWEAPLINPIF